LFQARRLVARFFLSAITFAPLFYAGRANDRSNLIRSTIVYLFLQVYPQEKRLVRFGLCGARRRAELVCDFGSTQNSTIVRFLVVTEG